MQERFVIYSHHNCACIHLFIYSFIYCFSPCPDLLFYFILLLFSIGTLDVPDGTTLRTHLSSILNCDPMRITKKFTGDSCIGKRIFQPLSRNSNENNNENRDENNCENNNDNEDNDENKNINRNRSDSGSDSNDENKFDNDNVRSNVKEIVSENAVKSTSPTNSNIENNNIVNDNSGDESDSNNSNSNDKKMVIDTTSNEKHGNGNVNLSPSNQYQNINGINNTANTGNVINNTGISNGILIDTSRRELKILRKIWLEKMLGVEKEVARKICARSTSAVKHSSGRNKVSTHTIYFFSLYDKINVK